MPARSKLFDPLRYLRVEMRVGVSLDESGGINLRFDRWHTDENRTLAMAVIGRYERLLLVQLKNGGASVYKLLAHGKIWLEEGRCMV